MQSSGQHLSKEMLDLIKSIGDSRSKQEEDKIILKEYETLKTKIKETGVSAKKMKEYLIRAIYIEMLGHEAPFAQFYAVNLTQDKNLNNKRVGYLACNLLLNEESEFLILLIASLQKDLQSQNYIEITMAMTSVVKFANPTIMQACTEPIVKLLDHRMEQVKKKAVMCLYRFWQLDPSYVRDTNDKMKKMLCDYDPSVMSASLNYFLEVIRKEPENYKDLVSSFVVILKQVIEHKLPREYDYHRLPAPWIQMKILEILSYLGKDDQTTSENMYEILAQVVRRADDTGVNISYAIIYQCVRTICIIYPNLSLIELASNTISRFLSSDSPNLKCIGINGLTLIIQINPDYVINHQQVIVDCLEANDETLKKNTFELLYKMTNTENVEVIIDKMMSYLRGTTLDSISKKDVLTKISELAERFAPDKAWYIKIMNQLFVGFGELITDEILSKLIKLINEWESETDPEEFQQFTIDNYIEIINNYPTLPDSLVSLIAWVIGEYSPRLFGKNSEKIENLIGMLDYLLSKLYDDERTKGLLLTAVMKLHSTLSYKEMDITNNIIERYSKGLNTELQQRALEYSRLIKTETELKLNPFTVVGDDLDIDEGLNFLNDYVHQAIRNGGKQYDRERYDEEKGVFTKPTSTLNTESYPDPSTLYSMPGKKANNQNILFTNTNFSNKNIESSELKVTGPRVWGKHILEQKEKPVNTFTNQTSNVFSNQGIPTTLTGNIITEPVKEKKPKKEVIDFDPKSQEKERLKNVLFGPRTGTSATTTSSTAGRNIMGSTTTTTRPTAHPTATTTTNNTPQIGNLLEIGTTSTSNSTTNQANTSKPLNWNELDDIFSVGKTETKTTSSSGPIDMFSGINVNASSTLPKTQNNNMFDILNMSSSSTSNKTQSTPSLKNEIQPMKINTDTFGEYWTDCPNDEVTLNIQSSSINNPSDYCKVLQNNSMHPVEIIGNEAIGAAILRGKYVLLHTTVNKGSLSVLVKCLDKSQENEVSRYLESVLR